jgi:hypothetical protein
MSAQGPDNQIQRLMQKHISPDGLTLNLEWNSIGDAATQALVIIMIKNNQIK